MEKQGRNENRQTEKVRCKFCLYCKRRQLFAGVIRTSALVEQMGKITFSPRGRAPNGVMPGASFHLR